MKLEGKIIKIIPWQSGKGFFLRLLGNGNDFYKFGQCDFKENDTVNIEYKAGTGNFKDRFVITKWENASPLFNKSEEKKEVKTQEKAKVVKDFVVDKSYEDYQITEMERCFICARSVKQAEEIDTSDIAIAFFEKRCKPSHYWELAR